jgi:hypothetical protein
MAAGLGFKDFATGEVLTAADVDGYLMQGVWVFASAAARDAAVTSPQEGNFAYLKDTNVTTYYTGSAWANLDSTGMTNPMTTTGDMIYSSSGSTPARLGLGTANQQLRVNSGATAPEWFTPAGGSSGLTKISKTSFSNVAGTGTTFDNVFTSTYDNYMLVMDGMRTITQGEQFQFVLRKAATNLDLNYGNVGIMGSTYSSVTNSASAKFDFGTGSTASGDSCVFVWYIFRNNNKISWTVQGMRRISNTGVFGGGFSNNEDADAGEADGFQLSAAAGNITGNVTIYGLEK